MSIDERTRQLLQDLVDGSLPGHRRAEAEDLLHRDAEARRFVEEHRALWLVLGEAFEDEGARSDELFRARVARAARGRSRAPLRRLALAAAVLLAVVGTWLGLPDAAALSPEDQQVVRYLHVLRAFDVLERQAQALDLRYDLEVLRAFEGEGEG